MAQVKNIRMGQLKNRLYRGYSSFNFEANNTTKVYDVECVKVELLNHIFTRRGSRVMMPTYGTIIPELLFEQITEDVIAAIEEDMLFVINYDPRIELVDEFSLVVQANADANSVTVAARIRYIELDYVDTFNLNIEFKQG